MFVIVFITVILEITTGVALYILFRILLFKKAQVFVCFKILDEFTGMINFMPGKSDLWFNYKHIIYDGDNLIAIFVKLCI